MTGTAGEQFAPEGVTAFLGEQALVGPKLKTDDAEPVTQQIIPTANPQGTIEPATGERLLAMWRSWYAGKATEEREKQKARRYFHAHQWTDEEITALNKRKQPVVTYNKVRRVITGLVGVEQKLRRDPKGFPRNPNDDDGADLATSALRYVQDTTRFHNMASEVVLDAFVTGVGGVYQSVMPKRGKLEVDKRQVNSARFFYDPRSEKIDFSDARFLGQHGWYDQDALIEMLPQAEKYLEAMMGASKALGGNADAHGLSTGGDIPTEALIDKEHVWVDGLNNRFFVVEIWYKRKGWWLYAFIIGQTKVTEGVSPYIDCDGNSCHPYEMFTVYIDERLDRYGVIRDLFSSQDEVNKRRSKMLHLGSVRQTAGVRGAVDDVDAMRRELARPDGHVEFNPVDATKLGGVPAFQVLPSGDQIQTHMLLAQEARAEIEGAGANPNIIGRGDQNQSGIAVARQQNAGMAELSMIYDNFREWKLRSYRHDWALVKQFWTDERWIRVTDDDGQPQFIGVNTPNAAPGGVSKGGPVPGPFNPGAMPAPQMPGAMSSPMGAPQGLPPGPHQMSPQPVRGFVPNGAFGHFGGVQPMGQQGPIIDMQGNPVPMLPQGGMPMGQPMPPPLIQNRIGEIDVDIILDDAPDTVTMQQEAIAQLMDLAKVYGPQAAPLDVMIDLIDLRPQLKTKIKNGLAQAAQPNPVQQMAAAKAEADTRAQNALANLREAQANEAGFGIEVDKHYAGLDTAKLNMEAARVQAEDRRTMADAQVATQSTIIDAHRADTERLKAMAALHQRAKSQAQRPRPAR